VIVSRQHHGLRRRLPHLPGKLFEEWVLDDPAGQGLDDVRPIHGEIERRVRTLLDELSVPAAS
jgi:hypothetical protein